MPTLIIVQVGLGRAMSDLDNNDLLERIEANKMSGVASSRSYIGSLDNQGCRSPIHDGRSYREAMRSHRSLSDATMNGDSPYTAFTRRTSMRSRGDRDRFGYDYPNASLSKRTLYDLSNNTYPIPDLPSLPP